ncbi:MAG: hypothetical protein RR346_11905 [Bacteroidales bacterium]
MDLLYPKTFPFLHTPYGVLSYTVRNPSIHRTESFHTPYGVKENSVRCMEGLRTLRGRIAYGARNLPA